MTAPAPRPWPAALWLLPAAALWWASHRACLELGFVGDDFQWWQHARMAIEQPGLLLAPYGGYRPLNTWTLALDHVLYGTAPWGYHLTSLLWHLGCGVALWAFLGRLGISAATRGDRCGAVAVLAVHPRAGAGRVRAIRAGAARRLAGTRLAVAPARRALGEVAGGRRGGARDADGVDQGNLGGAAGVRRAVRPRAGARGAAGGGAPRRAGGARGAGVCGGVLLPAGDRARHVLRLRPRRRAQGAARVGGVLVSDSVAADGVLPRSAGGRGDGAGRRGGLAGVALAQRRDGGRFRLLRLFPFCLSCRWGG